MELLQRYRDEAVGELAVFAHMLVFFCLPKWPVRHSETLEFMMMSVMSISFLMLIEV